MALRTWTRVLLTTAGVGLLAGTGQLGIAYGLRIVRFDRAFAAAARDDWAAQVGWVCWIAMVATVFAALAGERSARRHRLPAGLGRTVALAASAGVGAGTVAPLAMLPARAAIVAGVQTVPVVGLSVGFGVLLGVLAALAVLSEPAIRVNVSVVAGAVWALALVSSGPSFGTGRPRAVLPGVLDPAGLSAALAPRIAVVTMPAVALLAGAVVGWVARRRGSSTLTAAVCGWVGPALVAGAYLIAGPGDGIGGSADAAYWGSVLGVGAGALGSVLAVLVHRCDAAGPDRAGADEVDPSAGPGHPTGAGQRPGSYPSTYPAAPPAPAAPAYPSPDRPTPPAAGAPAYPLPRRPVPSTSERPGPRADGSAAPGSFAERQRATPATGPGDPPQSGRPPGPPAQRPAGGYPGGGQPTAPQPPAARRPAPRPYTPVRPRPVEPADRARNEPVRPARDDADYVRWVSDLGRGTDEPPR